MRLNEFVLQNIEPILIEWETFAATLLPAAGGMNSLALRDHAQQILEAVAKDLASPQTRDAQSEKSKGRAPRLSGAPETAAQTHAVLRAQSGFDVNQLVAEYRALRASVLRLWLDGNSPEASDLEDLVRFNEAIDQAIAESVSFFSAKVDQARNLLLGMLGHDMRSPLDTIILTATHLTALNAGTSVSDAASRLIRSGASIKALLDDLVDFNRINLGLGIKLSLAHADLHALFADELEQLRGAHPTYQLTLEVAGDVQGLWDGPRLQQMLRNLVVNAVTHGARDKTVQVTVAGEESTVRIEVKNDGPAIERSVMDKIFDPLKRGVIEAPHRSTGAGLGLGLFIVREIVRGHEGRVEARSDDTGTIFSVLLPRRDLVA